MQKSYPGTVDIVRDSISYNTLILPQNTLKHYNNIIIRIEINNTIFNII